MPALPLVFMVLWAILLFGGLVLGRTDAGRTRRMPLWTRIGSSAVLVVAAWLWLGTDSLPIAYTLLIAIGMSLGLAGDLFMARLLPVPNHVLGGMAAFGLGHVAYIAAFLTLGANLALSAGAALPAWRIWIVIGAAGWYLAVYRGQKATLLHWAALPYALLLASTAGAASGLAIQVPGLWPLALGGALFLTSDLILAARLFNGAWFPLIEDVVWLTYGPAQALIVYGVHLWRLSP